MIVLAYLHPGKVAGDFCRSVTDLMMDYPGLVSGQIAQHAGANISRARNEVAEMFLETDREWLFMVDSDMTFEPDALANLLAAADPVERPVVGGLCFAAIATPEGYRVHPTLYAFTDRGLGIAVDYPANTVMRVDATGAAFLLVHRSVFEKFPEGGPLRWFAETLTDDGARLRGEDITFFYRLKELDVPAYVHTGVKTGHVKQVVLDEATARAQRGLNGDSDT